VSHAIFNPLIVFLIFFQSISYSAKFKTKAVITSTISSVTNGRMAGKKIKTFPSTSVADGINNGLTI
jgi:hypothetical protein